MKRKKKVQSNNLTLFHLLDTQTHICSQGVIKHEPVAIQPIPAKPDKRADYKRAIEKWNATYPASKPIASIYHSILGERKSNVVVTNRSDTIERIRYSCKSEQGACSFYPECNGCRFRTITKYYSGLPGSYRNLDPQTIYSILEHQCDKKCLTCDEYLIYDHQGNESCSCQARPGTMYTGEYTMPTLPSMLAIELVHSIADQAYDLGWPEHRLWSILGYAGRKGLVACLDYDDHILEVNDGYIVIQAQELRNRFYRESGLEYWRNR